jgi:hypothetical protein
MVEPCRQTVLRRMRARGLESAMTHKYDDEDDEFFNDCDPEDDCFHENADIDILVGRALCFSCGHSWWMTDKEIEAEAKFQAEYFEAMAAEAESG